METLNQTPRWRFEMIQHLRPATVFDWGVNDEFLWAAYRTTDGRIAKRSKDDGRRLIESEIAFGKEVEGVKYLEKLICYKKKNGLREQ